MQPCHLEEVSKFFVDLKKFHLASLLSDGAETSHQFAHATAVDVINSREVEQESFVAGFGENMYQVPQLRAALASQLLSERTRLIRSMLCLSRSMQLPFGFTVPT